MLVLWLLSELYGWPASGLVVPGYLAGVLAIHPRAGLVVMAEAAITWGLAVLLIRLLPRLVPVDRAFGRDRFFLVLLLSVGVRLLVEGGPLDALLDRMGLVTGAPLNSLGLVLVPLTANAFWRTGIVRGLPLLGLPTLVVYLALTYVLLPHTNLSFAQFELTYEDLSLDFISSPRAYVILLTGTFLATLAAGRFGWDAGGVIIPGLLAIVWGDPSKILATLVEVLLIVALLRGVLLLPGLRRANLTGLRPLVLAFSLAYAVKLVVSWSLGDRYPGLRVTDLFGFGYLLPSLIAVRCWRHHSVPRVLVPAVLLSALGWVVGSGLGNALEQARSLPATVEASSVPSRPGPAWRAVTEVALPPSLHLDPTLSPELALAWRLANEDRPFEGERFRVDRFADGTVLHSGDHTAEGAAWLRPSARNDVVVLVPGAATTPGLGEAAVVVAETLDARALVLSPGPVLRRIAEAAGAACLEVVAESPNTFSLARRRVDAIDTQRLNQVLPVVPSWDLPRTGRLDARLALDEETILATALRRFDGTVTHGRLPLYDPDAVRWSGPERAAPDLIQQVLLERGVLGPLLKARTGDPRWLQLAAAQAERLQLRVAADEDAISLGPAPGAPPPRFSAWFDRHPRVPMVFEVRAAGRELFTAEVGRAWWAATGGSAVVVHDAGFDPDTVALQRLGTRAPEAMVLRSLVLDAPGTTVVSLDAWREDEFPGADAVISIGRPLASHDPIPDWLPPVAALVEGSGGTVAWYDGDYQRIRFYDPANPRRELVSIAGGQYAVAYLSPEFRARYAVPEHSAALRAGLAAHQIALGEGSLDRLLSGGVPAPEVVERYFARPLAALDQFARTGHPGALDRMARLARTAALQSSVILDPEDGLPYLVLEGRGVRVVTPFTRFRGELAPPERRDPQAVRLEGMAMALAPEGGAP